MAYFLFQCYLLSSIVRILLKKLAGVHVDNKSKLFFREHWKKDNFAIYEEIIPIWNESLYQHNSCWHLENLISIWYHGFALTNYIKLNWILCRKLNFVPIVYLITNLFSWITNNYCFVSEWHGERYGTNMVTRITCLRMILLVNDVRVNCYNLWLVLKAESTDTIGDC